MGNPNLSPLTATNFDLSAEYYIGRGGILSIAAFYKSIANPIYSTTVVESGTFAGRDLTDAQVTTAVNADSARSEEHTSELQSLMRISYAVFCLKKKTKQQ